MPGAPESSPKKPIICKIGAQEPKRPPGGANMPGAPGSSPKKPIMCKICAELCACAVVVTLGAPLLLLLY